MRLPGVDPAATAFEIGYVSVGGRLLCRVEMGFRPHATNADEWREAIFARCVQVMNGPIPVGRALKAAFAAQLSLAEGTPFSLTRVAKSVESNYNDAKIFRLNLTRAENPDLTRAHLFAFNEPNVLAADFEPLGAAFVGRVDLTVRRFGERALTRVSRDYRIPLWTCERSMIVRPAGTVRLGPERPGEAAEVAN